MYCQAALPLGDKKTFTRIGAMTRTIAMSYASSINPRNWDAMAILVCFDTGCSAIRTPAGEFSRNAGWIYLRSWRNCSPSVLFLRVAASQYFFHRAIDSGDSLTGLTPPRTEFRQKDTQT